MEKFTIVREGQKSEGLFEGKPSGFLKPKRLYRPHKRGKIANPLYQKLTNLLLVYHRKSGFIKKSARTKALVMQAKPK